MSLARKQLCRSLCASDSIRASRIAHPRWFSVSSTLAFNPTPRTSVTLKELDSAKDKRERVVVLGSGWAGYTLARRLDSSKFQTIIVSPRSYFAFTPLLASTSVGTLEFRTAIEPVRSKRSNVEFVQGWADAVDFRNKTVTIEEAVDDSKQGLSLADDRHGRHSNQTSQQVGELTKKGDLFSLNYDKLIIAVGCYSQTFGTPGVKEHALFLKDVGDARKIRNRLLTCFEMASLPTTSEDMKRMLLNFAVVGGGPTGIEFSAELHDIITEDLSRIYPELIKHHKITVYDVATKVLPGFDENLSRYAIERFRREGIRIKTSHHVQELREGIPNTAEGKRITDDHLVFTLKVQEEGEIGIGMCVWSTGLMMNPFVKQALGEVQAVPSQDVGVPNALPTETQGGSWRVRKSPRQGSIVTDDRLRIILEKKEGSVKAPMKDVFALGDCATLEDKVWPATAQVANQKAVWLAKRLNKGDLETKEGFDWKNMGVMAYLGDWNAILQTGHKGGISGKAAWMIWRGAYLTKSVSVRNKILIPIYWMINWIFGRDISRF